jgi:hypothetical protein
MSQILRGNDKDQEYRFDITITDFVGDDRIIDVIDG